MPIRTRDYHEPWDEQTAMTVATSRMVCPLVSIEQADRELDWRRSVWIGQADYGRGRIVVGAATAAPPSTPIPAPVPAARLLNDTPCHPDRATAEAPPEPSPITPLLHPYHTPGTPLGGCDTLEGGGVSGGSDPRRARR